MQKISTGFGTESTGRILVEVSIITKDFHLHGVKLNTDRWDYLRKNYFMNLLVYILFFCIDLIILQYRKNCLRCMSASFAISIINIFSKEFRIYIFFNYILILLAVPFAKRGAAVFCHLFNSPTCKIFFSLFNYFQSLLYI